MLKKDKKAALGEAMTWVVATIIVFVVMSIFIYASQILATYKTLTITSGEVHIDVSSRLDVKTELALKINDDNEDEIEEWIEKPPPWLEKNE
jgi:hypothetical protein